MPEDYRDVTTGAVMQTNASVHAPDARSIPRKTGKFTIRLRDGSAFTLSPGESFQAKGETYKLLGLRDDKILLGLRDDKIYIKALTSGRILTLGKRPPVDD